MKLLLDANLSPRIAARLSAAAHDAVHVDDMGLLRAADEEILAVAEREGFVLVSADTDFAMLLATTGAVRPSFVLLRSADRLAPDEQADLLLRVIAATARELLAGAIVTASRARVRVRSLPVRRPG